MSSQKDSLRAIAIDWLSGFINAKQAQERTDKLPVGVYHKADNPYDGESYYDGDPDNDVSAVRTLADEGVSIDHIQWFLSNIHTNDIRQ